MTRRVPYAQLRKAERELGEQHPNAMRVHAMWTPASNADIHVEVWTAPGHANVIAWEPQARAQTSDHRSRR